MKCHDCGQIQEDVGRLKESLLELDGKVEAVKKINETMNEKVEAVKEMNEKIGEKLEGNIGKVKKEVEDMKDNLSKVSKDVDEVKVMMTEMLEKFNILELLNKLPSPTEKMLNTSREDILIAARKVIPGRKMVRLSLEVSLMNEEHKEALSFIYNGQLCAVWGKPR